MDDRATSEHYRGVADEPSQPERSRARGSRGSFVGRVQVLDELERFVSDAVAGRGGLILIAGEPGIGKTTLVEALAARCPEARAIWGSCWEGDGAPALWPWVQVLRELAPHSVADRDRPILGRLVPELGSGLPTDAPLDEHARFHLFDAVAAFLRTSAEERTLLLILDDLQWADVSSLLLLGFLVPELRAARIAVVGTYRDAEVPSGHALHRIVSTRSSVVRLGGLDPEDVSELVRLVGKAGSAHDPKEIHRATGGNPFFVREMLRFVGGPTTLPDSVGEAIRLRCGRLSPECREMLNAAAVIGHRVRLDVLSRAIDVRPLGEALAARLLEEDPAVIGEVRFAHAVVREVLYRDLSPERRMSLHRRVGETLETLSAEEAELAHHFAQSAPLGTTTKAIEYAEKAGHRALAMFAYEEAAALFERALALLATTDRDETAKLSLALGRACRGAGRADESHAALDRAARNTSDPEVVAAAALEYGVEFTAGIVDRGEVRLLERALAELPVDDHPLRARLLGRLAKALLFTPATARRTELSEAAVAMARRVRDPSALAATLYDRHVAIWGGPNVEERLAIATEVIDLAERSRDAERSLQGRALRLGNLLELGDLAAFQSELDAYDDATKRLRQPQYLWHVPLLRATLAIFSCRFDAAERLAQDGLALGRHAQHQGVAVFHPAVMSTLRFVQGRFAETAPALRRGAEEWPSLVTFRCALAFALTEDGHDEEARQELERLTADGLVNVPRDFTWVANLALLSLAAVALDDRRASEMLYELLLPYRAYCVRLTRIGIGGLGPVAYFLGVLAATMGRWNDAAEHLARAIETNLRIGAPAFLANSRRQYARVLRAQGETERAKEEAERADSAAATLGFALMLRRFETRPTSAVRDAMFKREGEYWTLRFRGPAFRLKQSVGAAYIARLLAEPDRELHVLELSGAGVDDDGTPLLDARAKAEIRARLEHLEDEAREAESRGETVRAGRAREEIEAIAEQLAQAVGLGGRDRRAGSHVERARVRVTKAIKSTIRRIAEQDRALGDHLERSVRTGFFCRYAPDPALRVVWQT